MKNKIDKDIEELKSSIVGWTVADVLPCRTPESLFTLQLARGEEKKSIDLFATDLGWWMSNTGQHRWFALGPKASQAICQLCGLSKDRVGKNSVCKPSSR